MSVSLAPLVRCSNAGLEVVGSRRRITLRLVVASCAKRREGQKAENRKINRLARQTIRIGPMRVAIRGLAFLKGVPRPGRSTAILAVSKCAARTLVVHESFPIIVFPLACGLWARGFLEIYNHSRCIHRR